MDKREAMLRELNLYPLWVRRDPVACQVVSVAGPVDAPVVKQLASIVPVAVVASVVEPVELMSRVAESLATPSEVVDGQAEVIEDLFAAAPAAQSVLTGDSLREFQLQNAGGVFGRLDSTHLQQQVRDCERCGLRAACAQTVFGCGKMPSDWMFIGEAPGADEDAQGEPFVGHAGHLLDNMLMAIKLKRENVYIANVIKCRPPEDRHPHVGEIAACLPYLQRQIALVNPKVIVALGKTAASALLDTDATIASLRGIVHDYQDIPLIVTFHPAYLLRSPMEKAKAWQDLCLAVDVMTNQD